MADVQAALRRACARWGRPATFRVDNGGPRGSAGDQPPDLALWLIGLGIAMHWNDAHTPQPKGVVERSQGTGTRWAEPGPCATPAARHRRLQAMDVIQRAAYPSIAGPSRAAAFPGLKHAGQPSSAAWERRHGDHRRVLAHVAGSVVPRRVAKDGAASPYHRPPDVGGRHRGKDRYGMVDPARVEWVFGDAAGRQRRRQLAEELPAARPRGLTVTERR